MPAKTKTTAKPKVSKGPLRARATAAVQRLFGRTPQNPHHAFRLTKPRMYVTKSDLMATWRLQIDTWKFVLRFKRLLLGLGALYAVLAYVLVGGISQFDYVAFKDVATEVAGGDLNAVDNAVSMFGAAVTGNLSASPTDVQQFMSTALVLFFWLAIVWAARMLYADKEIRLRDALYNSGTPIIPTLVILSVIAVQLIPAALGIFGYTTALTGGWLTGGIESMAFAVAALLLCLLSAYFVVSSITALIVVTLPGTYPWQALRTAREMVMNRRWGMVLRVLVMALHIVALWVIVLIPIFLLDNWLRFEWLPLVPIFVQALIGLTLTFTSVYVYKLYRALL